MIDYALLIQAIADFRSGVRPSQSGAFRAAHGSGSYAAASGSYAASSDSYDAGGAPEMEEVDSGVVELDGEGQDQVVYDDGDSEYDDNR